MKTPSRKILSVVLAVAVLASLLATSVFAGQRAIGVGAVTAAQSTMRTGPESDAAELAQLTAGTDVAVLGQSGDWYHINYNDQYGYLPVSELEVSPTADDLETTGSVTAGTAVVRSAPELTAAGIGSADRYVSLEVTGFESGWFRVIFGEKEGYVRSDELTLNGAPIRASSRDAAHAIVACGSTIYDRSYTDRHFAILRHLYDRCLDYRRFASAALDCCMVACGRAEIFFECRLSPWDYAAGSLIAQEAGGVAVRLDGSFLDPLRPGSVFITNAACREMRQGLPE